MAKGEPKSTDKPCPSRVIGPKTPLKGVLEMELIKNDGWLMKDRCWRRYCGEWVVGEELKWKRKWLRGKKRVWRPLGRNAC